MKSILVFILLLCSHTAFAQTNLYKFSGAYVRAENAIVPEEIKAKDILNLEDAVKCPFPKFYFSADGEHGVTNWSTFPNSSHEVGAEFRIGVSRRIDNVLYLEPYEHKFRYFTEWDKERERPTFAYQGYRSHGERCFRVGGPMTFSTQQGPKFTEWIIVQIDEIDTVTKWIPAEAAQITPLAGLFQAFRNNDAELFMSHQSKAILKTAKKWSWSTPKILESQKTDLPEAFKTDNYDTNSISFLYIGSQTNGTIKCIHETGISIYRYLVNENDIWKIDG